MKVTKTKGVIAALSEALEKDPKLSMARIRLLLLIHKYDNKGTTTDFVKELGGDPKYLRKFIAEAEKAGYVEKDRFSDNPSEGDCIRYRLSKDSRKLLESVFGV